jgi:hypothetical protein
LGSEIADTAEVKSIEVIGALAEEGAFTISDMLKTFLFST